jgi:cell division protein FtsI/penicillin-binding protein 2
VKNRSGFFLIFFLVLFIIISSRLFYLQVIEHSFFMRKSLEQRKVVLTLSPKRGGIFDRRGRDLAISNRAPSIYLTPYLVKDKENTAYLLAEILKASGQKILKKMRSSKGFVWIERKTDEEAAQKIKDLKIEGVGIIYEEKRIYPKGHLASTVLGFTGIDNQGLAGLEYTYNKILSGEEGWLITEKDAFGREIYTDTRSIHHPFDGDNIYLTLDEEIQYIAEEELEATVKSLNAARGTVIVMDPTKGDIYALAVKNDFDPNYFYKFKPLFWRNFAVSDLYEPGSTFKLFAAAAAIEEKIVTPETVFSCPNSIMVGGRKIGEAHEAIGGHGMATVREIIVQSLNVGAAQIGLKLGAQNLINYVKKFSFDRPTRLGLAGEVSGLVREASSLRVADVGRIPFGQGVAITPMQLIYACTAFANNGFMVRPRIIKEIVSSDGRFRKKNFPYRKKVLSEATAHSLKMMMNKVVAEGTGKAAALNGYSVCGKTGTAQKVALGGSGYLSGRYVPSFVGFFPGNDTKLLICVVVDDPRGTFWGSTVAAPLFKKVAERSVRYLGIPPDIN